MWWFRLLEGAPDPRSLGPSSARHPPLPRTPSAGPTRQTPSAGALCWAPLRPTAQHFALFFPSPATTFALFVSLWGSSRGILVFFFLWPGPSNVRVWALGLSCETPAALGRRGFHLLRGPHNWGPVGPPSVGPPPRALTFSGFGPPNLHTVRREAGGGFSSLSSSLPLFLSFSFSFSFSFSPSLSLLLFLSFSFSFSLYLSLSLSFSFGRGMEGPRAGSRQRHHSTAARITVIIYTTMTKQKQL